MDAYECYKLYLAVKRHFDSSYDCFKYNGKVKVTPEAFRKRKDVRQFVKLSNARDPRNFIIGNYLYNNSNWPGSWNIGCQNQYEKYQSNGIYHFTQDIKLLKDDFSSNFTVD